MDAQATMTKHRIENLVIFTSRIILKRAYYDLFTGIRLKKPKVVKDFAGHAESGKIGTLKYFPIASFS
jgi:hypothetical protein